MARLLPVLCLLLASVALAQKISSFETPQEVALLAPGGVQVEQVKEHATDGQYSLKVSVKGSTTDSWPGLTYVPANPDLSQVAVIACDIFNPQDFPIALSYRLDDAAGKNQFGGAELKPGANKVEIWLTSVRFALDTKHMAKIYPYFRMPRRDFVVYVDNLRFETAGVRFKAMNFVETNPEPAYSAQDTARGYVVFARPWLSSVFPNSVPRANELAPTLAVFGCPGQIVPVTFCVRALQDLGPTSARPTPLALQRVTLPPGSVQVYPVSHRDKRLVYSSDSYIKDMPALLEQRESVAIPRGRTQTFWINIKIPQEALAGQYEGLVTVQPTQGQRADVPLRLRVLPYSLVEPKHMFWGEYYQKPSFAKTPADELAAVERELADQRAHGMTSIGLCYGLEGDEFAVDGTQVTLNLKPDGLYTKTVETYKQLGFPMPIVQLNDTGQTAAGKYPFGSPEYVTTYKNFWTALAKLHQERGWAEVIVQPVDEPAWQGPEERSRNTACLKWLKEIPGLRTEEDGPVDSYFTGEAGPFADMWNGNGAVPTPEVMKQAQDAGKLICSYNNDVESYRPEMDRYCDGFYQLRSGARGTFNWAYISFAGNPYDDQDADTGSWMHVYPPLPELGEVGGPSTGWEGARAGVDDFKYAYTLQRAIERAERSDRGAARQAALAGQQTLAAVLAGLQYDPQTRGTAKFAEELPGPNGTKILHGELKVPNGWDFDMYDKARWQLAAATMNVLAALGEVPADAVRSRVGTREAIRGVADGFLGTVNWSKRPEERGAAGPAGQKQATIPVVDAAPVCDGDLSDAAWQKAAKLEPFVRMDGNGVPSQQTTVRVCADATKLYLGAELAEENLAHITARVDKDGGPVWEDDCLEIFVDSTLQRKEFVQICINSLGRVYASNPRDKSWAPVVDRSVKVDTDKRRWIVEMGIPLGSLGLTSNVFGLNIGRERRPLESLELSCWSPTGDGFAHPDRFGVAAIGGSYLTDFKIGRGVLGANELSATIRNDDTVAHNFLAILDWKQGGKVALYRQKGPLALAPGKQETVSIPYEVTSDHDPLSVGLTVKDADTGKTYAARNLDQQIQRALTMTFKPNLYYLSDDAGLLHVDINLDTSLQEKATLTVAVFKGASDRAVRTQTVPVDNERLDAAVNLAGLPAGMYRLEVILKSGSTRLATEKATVTKVPGPF